MKNKILIIVASLIVFSMLLITGCVTKLNPIVGTWDYDGFVYTFNKDKTGTYDLMGQVINFTYEAKDDVLQITRTDETEPYEMQYRIEDNKLIVKDSFGEDVTYIKVEQ